MNPALLFGGAAIAVGLLSALQKTVQENAAARVVPTRATKMQVGCLQYALNRKYGLALPERGVYDVQTQAAVARAQADLGLAANGVIDLPLLTRVGGCGSMSDFYRCAQRTLNATPRPDGSAYTRVDEDGELSSPLVRAIREFQADYHLPVTGILDLDTLNTIRC